MLKEGGPAIPIFCVASGHCLKYTYVWRVAGRRVGSNSCVLWVNQPGVYDCCVKHNIMTAECSSHYISVIPEGKYYAHKSFVYACIIIIVLYVYFFLKLRYIPVDLRS